MIARKYGACDVEIGGNDQYFNLLAGRTLLAAHGLPKQDIMTFELLMGTDGEKMSKSKPNCILIDDTPFDMYQKLINVRDDLMLHYFELATDMTLEEVDQVRVRLESGEHPNAIKKELADRIITMYHGAPYNPDDVSNREVQHIGASEMSIGDLLKAIGFCATSGDVRNAIAGGSVRIDSVTVTDPKLMVQIPEAGILIEMGKKKAKNIMP